MLFAISKTLRLIFFFFFIFRPRLKNIDRSSARNLEVTVGDLTVIITDFKEKAKPMSTSPSAASADQHSQSGSSSDNTEWRLLQLPARDEELGSSPWAQRDNYNMHTF